MKDEERQSMEEMYEEYYSKIYNYVYYRILHKEKTEDIVSNIFVKVVSKIETFNEKKASFSTWIFKIAQNTLTDYYRGNKQSLSIEELAYEGRVAFEGECCLIQEETNREVYRVLQVLREQDREIIYMKFYLEMKNKQIAELLGINESALSTKLSRVLHKLKGMLSEDEYRMLL